MQRLNLIAAIAILSFAGRTESESSNPREWCGAAAVSDSGSVAIPASANLPEWVCEIASTRRLADSYSLMTEVNPFFLMGDFDGDGHTDIALRIRNRQSGSFGLAIIHYDDRKPFVIGAGKGTDNKVRDFPQADAWTVLPKGKLKSPFEPNPVSLAGDAILISRWASSSSALYWNGSKYEFVADVLGVGGIGYATGPGEYAPSRPWENLLLPDGA